MIHNDRLQVQVCIRQTGRTKFCPVSSPRTTHVEMADVSGALSGSPHCDGVQRSVKATSSFRTQQKSSFNRFLNLSTRVGYVSSCSQKRSAPLLDSTPAGFRHGSVQLAEDATTVRVLEWAPLPCHTERSSAGLVQSDDWETLSNGADAGKYLCGVSQKAKKSSAVRTTAEDLRKLQFKISPKRPVGVDGSSLPFKFSCWPTQQRQFRHQVPALPVSVLPHSSSRWPNPHRNHNRR